MASTLQSVAEPAKIEAEATPAMAFELFRADFTLRILLFATTLVALVVMVTSKQSVLIVPLDLVLDAKFTYSPALIYFVVVMSVACLYSLVTAAASALALYKPFPRAKLLLYFGFLDALMVGVVASATGAVASIAYVGLRGNSHVYWMKICNRYGKFCRHVGTSITISLVASIILVLLVMISTYSLYHRSR